MRYDYIEEVKKYNPYHGKDGRFTSKNGGGAATGASTKATGAVNAKLGDIVDWRGQPHVIISDSGGKNGKIKLRPVSRYGGESDFDGGGDSFDDVHLDRYQLRDAELMSY